VTSHQGDAVPSPASREFGSSSAVASWPDETAAPGGFALEAGGAPLDVTSCWGSHTITGAFAAAALRIECGREGFARARTFTRETLRGWSLDHCGDDAAVVVTELAANAARHALPFTSGGADLWLGLALDAAHLVLTVSDPCDSLPVPASRAGSDLAEGGRGLCIVEALAEEWGWAPRPPAGKTVWAKLPARPPH
jgi:hypothetical protein